MLAEIHVCVCVCSMCVFVGQSRETMGLGCPIHHLTMSAASALDGGS